MAFDELKRRASDGAAAVVSRAAKAVLSDPRGQEAVAAAVGAAQRGVERAQKAQHQLLAALGFASKADYEALLKPVARLKRKARELGAALDALSR